MSDHQEPTDAERQVWMGMARVVASVSRKVDHALVRSVGLSLSEMTLLGQTLAAGGAVRMSDLAMRLQVTRAAVTRLADKLEGAGDIRRLSDPDDGRATRITLTGAGAAHLRRAERVFHAEMRLALWQHLSHEEAASMAEMLGRIQQRLRLGGDGVVLPASDQPD